LVCQSVSAQELKLGVHVGGNVSGFAGGRQYVVYDKTTKAGLELGADVQYLMKNRLCIASGLSLVQTGGKFSVMSSYVNQSGSGYTEFPAVNAKALSLEIPLKLGYNIAIGERVDLVPMVGAYARYGLSAIKDDVNITGYNDGYKWNCYTDLNKDNHHIDALKRFEYGVVVGVGAKVANHYTISLNYLKGLNTLSKQYNLKKSNLAITIGYLW
ncbi:MAG: outer membrane beta-barrel protein, partial [Bacteroidaceae bacterium]|nr:outer membrane beta-barrel protein [Bacteroidaceae bacterium]